MEAVFDFNGMAMTVRRPDAETRERAEDVYHETLEAKLDEGVPSEARALEELDRKGVYRESVEGIRVEQLNDEHGRDLAALALDGLPPDEGRRVAVRAAANRAEWRTLTLPWVRAVEESAEGQARRTELGYLLAKSVFYRGKPFFTGGDDSRIDGLVGRLAARKLELLMSDNPDYDDQDGVRSYLVSVGLPANYAY